MSRRSYHQFCGLAGALDVVGERWTLLIVRDLSGGPQRYSDLAGSLDGIGTSLLATRLKQLESAGLVRRRELPPPAASVVYELTDVGWELTDALIPLASWGARHGLGESRSPDQAFRPEWSLAMVARALRNARGDDAPPVTIEFVVDGAPAIVAIDGPHSSVSPWVGDGTFDASIVTDAATLAAVVARRIDLGEALRQGRIEASGDPGVLVDLAAILPPAEQLTRPRPPAAP